MKKILTVIIAIIIGVIIIGAIIFFGWYNSQLKAVNVESKKEETIEIESGMSTEKILKALKEKGLINNVIASKIYIKLNNIKGLQAGKYTLNTGMSLKEILKEISVGNVDDEQIKITFLEGKNMRWIAKEIATKTNNTEDDVYKLLEDEEYIQSLIDQYWFLTDEINNENIYYPLEGYLYPETYNFKNEDVSVKEIFSELLNQTDKILTKYKEKINQMEASVHQILTIASIVELEGRDSESREGIASVIYNRLEKQMSLGSDVTTYYAVKVDMAERNLYATEINTYNPYNTRGPNMAGKLPIGPIASVSEESIKATLNYTNSEYLYFVSDMNGKIYFTKTYKEHQEKIAELQKKGLWYEY